MKIEKAIAVVAIVLIASFIFAGCAPKKNDPKALAKQTVELTAQLLTNPGKADEINKKLEEIGRQVDALSFSQKLVYTTEFAKLSVGAMGDALGEAASNFSSELNEYLSSDEFQEARKSVTDAVNSIDVQGAINEFNQAINSAEFQDAIRDLNEALNSEELKDALKDLSNTQL